MYLASYMGRHRFRVVDNGHVMGQIKAILQAITQHWVQSFTTIFKLLSRNRSRECVANHHEVTPHRLTIISEPEQEPSPVEYFLLSGALILYFIHGNTICLPVNHGMNVVSPSVFQLPVLASEGIQAD